MRSLLLVCHGYPLEKMGGVGLYVQALAIGFFKLGWKVSLLVPRSGMRNRLEHRTEDWGTTTILHHRALTWSSSWNNKHSQRLLRSWLHHLAPDVCHIHHLSGLPLNLSDLLPQQTLKVLTFHDYSVPCARGQLFHRDHFICSGPSAQKCSVCLDPFLFASPPRSVEHRLELSREMLSSLHLLFSPSKDLILRIREMHPTLEITHTQLPLLSDTSVSSSQERDFIFVGSLLPTKGLDLAIRGFLPFSTGESSLTIVGHASIFPTWPNYVEWCQSLALSHPDIRWIGGLSQADTVREMSKHRCLVLPSAWPENSPLSIREATAMGLHVICGSTGGASELSPVIQTVSPRTPRTMHQLYRTIRSTPLPPKRCWSSVDDHCHYLQTQYEWQNRAKQNIWRI